MKVFSSWSGGKECALATYEAISQGHEVLYLLNFISENGERSRSHGTKAGVLALQAEAIGIPLVQVKTSWEGYEQNFKKAVGELKDKGIEGGVFGDIDLEEHREWVEKVCGEVGIKAFLPLWGAKPEKLIDELLTLKFRAMVVATRLDENFLGKEQKKYYVPASDFTKILPVSDIIVITGCTLVNNTIDDLISAIPLNAQVVVSGPSSSLLPDILFENKVSIIGATRITDPDMAFAVAAQAGSGYHLFRYCARKICILNEKRV